MAFVPNSAVDGPGGISSLTQDPFIGIEFGRTGYGVPGVLVTLDDTGGSETELILIDGGDKWSGTSATNRATTNIKNPAGITGTGSGLTVDITAVDGGAATKGIVGNAAGSGYRAGDRIEVTVNGSNAAKKNAVFEIPFV